MSHDVKRAVDKIREGGAALGRSASNLPDEIQSKFIEAHLHGFGEALADGMGRALAAEYLYRAADHVVAIGAPRAPSIQPDEGFSPARLSALLRKLRGL